MNNNAIQMLQMLAQKNPNVGKMLNMVNNGQLNMEQMCREICKQKGIDFDKTFAQFQQQNNNKR